MTESPPPTIRFVEWLHSNRDNRGVMADLRRAMNPATAHRAWPHLARWCDLTSGTDRLIHATVAATFALQPESEPTGNLGTTLRRIAQGENLGDDGLKSFEGRFRRLLTCDTRSEICERLLHVVRAAARRDVPVNHFALFNDLRYWGEKVKLRWAAQYWKSKPGAVEEGG